MAWIEASAAGGGSTGGGNTIMVTCSDSFAGLPITCTNGLTTKTLNCPSTAPYVIQFTDIIADEWTISGTIDGTTYSTTVEVGDIFTTTLESGFQWKTWVDLSQNYHSSDYNSLSEVFADGDCVRELMTIHACCDYLIEAVSDDIDVIDDFVANDTAMKWIGLRDYVCDGLTAISGVVAKFLASQYWERYLKDHVPTMTSNTAPYGVAGTNTTIVTGHDAYKSFRQKTTDEGNLSCWAINGTTGRLYCEFVNPISVKKICLIQRVSTLAEQYVKTATIQYSDDGTTWYDDAYGVQSYSLTAETPIYKDVSDNGYHKYWGLLVNTNNGGSVTALTTLQFYGRSLNVSVPVMTSNNAPYGEAFADSSNQSHPPYMVFDNVISTSNYWGNTGVNHQVGYKFDTKVCVKKVSIIPMQVESKNKAKDCVLKGSNDGTNYTPIDNFETVFKANNNLDKQWFDIDGNTAYQYIMLDVTAEQNSAWVHELQFYGLDYSEREFEPNTTKKWLYDHGVELETLTTSGTVTKGSDYLTLSAANSEATASVDLTDYSILRCKVGDHMSGTTQLSVGGSNPATATLTSANAPNNFSLGTSLFDQTLATGVKMTANGICDITELWLE